MKYVTIPALHTKSFYVEDHCYDATSMKPSLTVDGEKTTYTGLIDKDEKPIYRLQDPIGF